MPCTYVSVAMQEKERERAADLQRRAEEERKKQEIAKKKRTIFKALAAMGWSLDDVPETTEKGQTLILVSKD